MDIIKAETREHLDETIRIPLTPTVESLNVAVSAALLCFAVAANPPEGSQAATAEDRVTAR